MSATLKVVNPVGESASKAVAPSSSPNTLNGKKVCEIWNGSFEGHVSFPIIREMLRERYPDITVIPYTEFPLFPVISLSAERKAAKLESVRKAILEKGCDVVITGNGG
ncbi:MAG: hypothetical protein ABSH06_01340 [Thermodesulfobacteriota bacterium]